jgi:hypothetical protein
VKGTELTSDAIADLLVAPSTGRKKGPVTEPRIPDVWFKLNHHIREEGCDNEECADPRPRTNKGVNIVAEIKGKMMCRYCFLGGWLSDATD